MTGFDDPLQPPRAEAAAGPAADEARVLRQRSVAGLLGSLTRDLSLLFRHELALAKAELSEEAARARKPAARLLAAGAAAFVTVLLLAFALVEGLALVLPAGLAFLLVGLIFAGATGVLYGTGRRDLEAARAPGTRTSDDEEQA